MRRGSAEPHPPLPGRRARVAQPSLRLAILGGLGIGTRQRHPGGQRQAQREREEEYLFRAREYARGVMKWQHKYGASFPPSLDVLVEQRFVRRKYKDPLSGQDFNPVFQTAGPIGQPGVGSAGGSATPGQIPQDRKSVV